MFIQGAKRVSDGIVYLIKTSVIHKEKVIPSRETRKFLIPVICNPKSYSKNAMLPINRNLI